MRRIVTQSTVWISYSLKWIDFHPSSKSFLSWLGCFMPGGCAEAPVIMTEHWSDIFMCSGREGLRSFSQMLAKSSLIRRASYFFRVLTDIVFTAHRKRVPSWCARRSNLAQEC